MSRIFIISFILLFLIENTNYAQKSKTDANIIGHVISNNQHLPFANVAIKGTTIGTLTDETGHYQLINLPLGEVTIVVSTIGYKTQEKVVICQAKSTIEINFEVEEDVLKLDEVVVSADRNAQKRTDAPVIVNTISPKLFNSTQSITLGESLNFSPGLRLENNCQNCGFTQVRMNGMDGAYSQILINSRPIFSGLAGVYGLELIPTNMLERVEVVRGGGSALYGSNAIAGTINLILKDPVRNTYEIAVNYGSIGVGVKNSGGSAPDYSINLNTSLVSNDGKSGLAIYGFARARDMFDANNDGFSEIAPMNSLTLGSRLFHRIGNRGKLALDLFFIKEKRDGGNKQDYPAHERDIAEALQHDLKTTAITFEQYFRDYDLFSAYVSGQFLNRDSYYGANKSLSDYGNSQDKTYNIGAQYKTQFSSSSLVTGIENTSGFLIDKKLGYPDYDNAIIVNDTIISVPHVDNMVLTNQSSMTIGIFAQYEFTYQKAKFAIGGRFDHYDISNLAENGEKVKVGNVFSPRLSFMYEILKELQARISYSRGYRAPQLFDEDLHIAASGSRQVIYKNDPNLTQETSYSLMASLDFNGLIGKVYTGLLIEGFYTRLKDAFVNEIGAPDINGVVIYTRRNADEGAIVQGINIEFKLKPLKAFGLTSGFTFQSSKYEEPQEFGETRFFRTPNQYGYFELDWDFAKGFCLSASGVYTGSMLVPYFGPEANEETGELRTSDPFFDLGTKLSYSIKLNGASLQFFGGVKNIFNSYQSDFDYGIDRDPSYIYGPVSPRTIYFGIKFGNILN